MAEPARWVPDQAAYPGRTESRRQALAVVGQTVLLAEVAVTARPRAVPARRAQALLAVDRADLRVVMPVTARQRAVPSR